MKILRLEIRRAERALQDLVEKPPSEPVPNELEESPYLPHTPAHQGPEYLTVRCSCWNPTMRTKLGDVTTLASARLLAEQAGLKGIAITFGEMK